MLICILITRSQPFNNSMNHIGTCSYYPIYPSLSCSHTYTDLGADPGGSATDVIRHCPPWSVLIRHHPPSSQSHYGGYATFLLRTRYDLMLSDGGLAADWRRTSGNRSRKTTVTLRWLASLGGRTTANPPRGAALFPRSVVETSECRSTTAAGPCP